MKPNRWTLASALLLLGAATTAAAFELKTPVYSCRGHEYLATEAAVTAGIPKKYHASLAYGIRYVDLGGMRLAVDGLSVFGGKLNKIIHENEATQHHHFCLRGGLKDLPQLIGDTAAWVQKLYRDAQGTESKAMQTIKDGGAVSVTSQKVHTRYFLLGAALHAIQDSFAHGYRSQTYGKVKSYFAGSILEDWGGRRGTKFGKYYRTIRTAVLYPDAKPGTAKHNHVYSKIDGSPYFSDKIWNATVCDTVRDHLGNLQPHAFAAYLASVDFLEAFRGRSSLMGFFKKWFSMKDRGFPGIGNPRGKCSSGKCPTLTIPGESKTLNNTLTTWTPGPSKPTSTSSTGHNVLGRAFDKVKGWFDEATSAATKAIKKGKRKVSGAASRARRALGRASEKIASVSAKVLKLRKGPSQKYSVVGKLRKGNRVYIVSKKGGWYKVKLSRQVGWVYGKYLKVGS